MAAVNTISVVPVKLVLGVGAVTTISVVARLGAAGLCAGGSSESTLILRGFIGSTTTLTSTGTEF